MCVRIYIYVCVCVCVCVHMSVCVTFCNLFFHSDSIMRVLPKSLMSGVLSDRSLQWSVPHKLLNAPIFYHHHQHYNHHFRQYTSSHVSKSDGITAISPSAAGFNNYEKEKKTFHLNKPEYYNFATDVIDKWAKVSIAEIFI